MSSNFPAILNPMEELINSGLEIRAELQKAAIDLELAIEGQFSKRQVAKELKRIYDEMEAEYTAETMFAASAACMPQPTTASGVEVITRFISA